MSWRNDGHRVGSSSAIRIVAPLRCDERSSALLQFRPVSARYYLLVAVVNSRVLPAQAGLHTGECEVRGDDIGGIGVHIGARVSALAGSNDVLVSSTLRDLVIGSGIEFEERGAHSLKGVPGEWRLFAVVSA
jgi:class 3 adenylate cyclase